MLFRNSEYYPDPTAAEAIRNVLREEHERKQRNRRTKEGKTAEEEMTEEGYSMLAHEIILLAVRDFRAAYTILKKYPGSLAAAAEVNDLTEFFTSEHFRGMSKLDGPSLLKRIMREIDEKYPD